MTLEARETALLVANAIEELRVCRARLVHFALYPSWITAALQQGSAQEKALIPIINDHLRAIGGVVVPFSLENDEAQPLPGVVRLTEWYGYDQNDPTNDLWVGYLETASGTNEPLRLGQFSLDAIQTVTDIRLSYSQPDASSAFLELLNTSPNV
jgi:hypothetical protein